MSPMNPKRKKDTMVFLNGSKVSFRCDCGGNVFTEVSPLCYQCNSCGARYTGEKSGVKKPNESEAKAS